MADIQLGAEGRIKSGRSVWEEKTNRKMWVRNGTWDIHERGNM